MESIVKFDLIQFISDFENSQMARCSVMCFDDADKCSIVEFEKHSWETLVFVFDNYSQPHEICSDFNYKVSSKKIVKNVEFDELQEFAQLNLKTYHREFYKFVRTVDILDVVINKTEEIFRNENKLFNEFGIITTDAHCSNFKLIEAFGLTIKSYSYMKPTGDVKWGNYIHEILADAKFTGMHDKPLVKIEISRGDLYEKKVYGSQEFTLTRGGEIKSFQKNYYNEKEVLCVNFDDIPEMKGMPFEKRRQISFDFKIYSPKRSLNDSFILSKYHWSLDLTDL